MQFTGLPILYGLSDIPASASTSAQAQRNIRAFARAGIGFVCADTELRLGWHKHTPFDADALISEVAGVLDANPEAGVLLRLHVNPPYFWLRDHPSELVRYREADGTDRDGIDDGESDRLIRDDFSHHMRVSLASEVWLAEAGEKLRAFCRAIADTPEGNALIGIQIACGGYGEWHQWGTDCGEAMQARFVRYLQETYGAVEALRRAWHDETVTFETARFLPQTWQPADDGAFRDPRSSQPTIDSQRCLQLCAPRAILHFCRIVKEELPKVLAGCFYGYYTGLCKESAPIVGHLYPQKLLAARGTVDFLCGPLPYMENRKVEGVALSRGLLESCRLNGILWLTEMDQHPEGTEAFIGGDPAKLPQTVALLRRNTLQPLLAGMGFWYYDHRIIPSLVAPGSENSTAGSLYRKNGWWENPALMAEIARQKELVTPYFAKPYSPAADVLIAYDTDSFFYRAKLTDPEYMFLEAVARTGAAYDAVYLSDLPKAELSRYRCVLFPNAYALSDEQLSAIHTLCKDHTVLFFYATGFCDQSALCDARISESVGMRVMRCAKQSAVTAKAGYGGKTYSVGADVSPMFAVADEEAEPIAVYAGTDLIAAAQKGNRVYFAAPVCAEALLTPIFAKAGVHRYLTDGSTVLAGAGLLAVCTYADGAHRIRFRNGLTRIVSLPAFSTTLFDVQTGEILEENAAP